MTPEERREARKIYYKKWSQTEEAKRRRRMANQKYRRTKKGKICSKRHAIKQRESGWLKKFRASDYQRERMRKYHSVYKTTKRGREVMKGLRDRGRNREKDLARKAVSYAVKIGKLDKLSDLKCQSCSNRAYHYHHPSGYSGENRLKVIPLCEPCHIRIHRP